MIRIDDLQKVDQFNAYHVAYILIPDFKSYLKLYKQIMACERIENGNRDCWIKDWLLGEDYVRAEFDMNFKDGYLHLRVYKTLSDNLKLSFIGELNDGVTRYEFVANSYQIDLI